MSDEMMEPKILQIGEVAARTGLSLKTIRWYGEVGLLAPERSDGGFRLYDEHAVQRLLLIMHMKPLDFSLAEMKELLDAVHPFMGEGPVPVDEVERRQLVQRYRGEVEARAAKLRKRLSDAHGFADRLTEYLED